MTAPKTIDVREALESEEELPDEGGDVWAEPKRPRHYVLDGKNVVPATPEEWGRFLQTADRRVALDFVGDHRVSTVFLGLDHNWSQEGPPLIFETMVFADEGWDEQDCYRCSTYEEAELQHAQVYSRLKAKYWLDGKLN